MQKKMSKHIWTKTCIFMQLRTSRHAHMITYAHQTYSCKACSSPQAHTATFKQIQVCSVRRHFFISPHFNDCLQFFDYSDSDFQRSQRPNYHRTVTAWSSIFPADRCRIITCHLPFYRISSVGWCPLFLSASFSSHIVLQKKNIKVWSGPMRVQQLYSKPTNRHPAELSLHPSMDGKDKLLCLLRNSHCRQKVQNTKSNSYNAIWLLPAQKAHYTEHRLNSNGQIMWTVMKKACILRWLCLCQSLCFTFSRFRSPIQDFITQKSGLPTIQGISEENHRATFSASVPKVQINKSTALREINQGSQQVAAVQSKICIQWHNEEHNLGLAF